MRLFFILLFLLSLLVGCSQKIQENSEHENKTDSISWTHLSSKTGDIPAPGPSTQQTASQVLDIDQDGINDFVIAARQVGPAVLWYRRTQDGWEKYVIDIAYLRIEVGGAHYDIDQDGDLDILDKPYTWDTPRIDVWINESQ